MKSMEMMYMKRKQLLYIKTKLRGERIEIDLVKRKRTYCFFLIDNEGFQESNTIKNKVNQIHIIGMR